jgi:hypothetical protein
MTTILTTRRRHFRLDLEPSDCDGDQGAKRFDYDHSHKGIAPGSASAAAISIRSGVRVKSMLIILDADGQGASGGHSTHTHRALSTMTTILTTRRRRFRLDLEPCDCEGDQGAKRFDNNRSHQGVARNSASAAAISISSGVRVKSMLIILDADGQGASGGHSTHTRRALPMTRISTLRERIRATHPTTLSKMTGVLMRRAPCDGINRTRSRRRESGSIEEREVLI